MAGDDEGRAAARRTDTRDPRASRLAVLRVLYEADLRGEHVLDVMERHRTADNPAVRARRGELDADIELDGAVLDEFAITLLHGLGAGLEDIDARISRFAKGWRLARMPVIDRNVLRLAIHELLTEPTPVAIVLDEAVRLVGELSTDDSGRFVNGVLAAIVRDLAQQQGGDVSAGVSAVDGPADDARAAEQPPLVPPSGQVAPLGPDVVLALLPEPEAGTELESEPEPGPEDGPGRQGGTSSSP
jgi:transcription antitermination protein NusB